MEVNVWSSDWGLPSIEPKCLQMITYAKFSGAPLQVKETSNPFWSPRGDLPVFTHLPVVKNVTDFNAFVSHLRMNKFSANYNLSALELVDARAISELLVEKLHPEFLYTFWIDPKNYDEMTRPWYAKNIPFPLNFYYPSRLLEQAIVVIETRFGCQIGDPVLESAIQQTAKETFELISRRLGNTEPYLFGKSPSSADAVLYSYLAPLLNAPFPNPSIQNSLRSFPNLVSFVGRISNSYFPQITLEYEKKVKEKQRNRNSSNEEEKEKPLASRLTNPELINRVCSIVVACAAMTAYAHFSGIIEAIRNIRISFEEIEENDEEDLN